MIRTVLAVTALATASAAVVFLFLVQGPRLGLSIGVAAIAAIMLWTVAAWLRGASVPAGIGHLLLIGALAIGFSRYKNYERTERSSYLAAQQLRRIVGERAAVTTWYTLWAQPEVLYYAGVDARPVPLGQMRELNEGWVLFYQAREGDPDEWTTWQHAAGERLSRITTLRLNKAAGMLAWYSPHGR